MEYIENPNAPTFRAHALHDLDFIGGHDGLFTLVHFKKTAGGVWYKETALWVELPVMAIPPAVALTTSKMGGTIIAPIREAIQRIAGLH